MLNFFKFILLKSNFILFFWEGKWKIFWNLLEYSIFEMESFKLKFYFLLGSPHVLKLPLYYILYLLDKL
jgi:hypothetical protein